MLSLTVLGYYLLLLFIIISYYECDHLMWAVMLMALGFERDQLYFLKHHQFIYHFSFSSLNHRFSCWMNASQYAMINWSPDFRMKFPLGWYVSWFWRTLSLSWQLEILVNLSWRCPTGLSENNFLRSPHWPCLIIMSPQEKHQPDHCLLATSLNNVTIYEQLWHGHPLIFRITAYINPSYMMTWNTFTQE